jgi:hypothetical protein
MQLEIIKLNERRQFHKDKYCLFSLICGIQVGNKVKGKRGRVTEEKK